MVFVRKYFKVNPGLGLSTFAINVEYMGSCSLLKYIGQKIYRSNKTVVSFL